MRLARRQSLGLAVLTAVLALGVGLAANGASTKRKGGSSRPKAKAGARPVHRAAPRPPAPAPRANTPPPLAANVPADRVAFATRLGMRLEAVLADSCLRGAKMGVTVRDPASGAVLYERGGDQPLAPASNMKLITAGAVTELMGPERTLQTLFRADHAPDAQGDVGTLYVVGGGDPSLTIEALYIASRELAAAGVRHVSGVVVDDGWFAGPSRPPTWPMRNFASWYSAPTSALCTNFNVVTINARGGGRAGEPAVTWVDPFPTYFDVVSTVGTGPGTWRAACSMVTDAQGATEQRIELTGRVPVNGGGRVVRPVEDPALFCGHGVAESLRRVGVEVEGEPRHGQVPPGAILLHAHRSRPIAELVRDMDKQSSNLFAETLLRDLGGQYFGAPATREKGLDVLRSWLAKVSPTQACRLEDGSGLSPDARVTTRLLSDVVLAMTRDSYARPEFLVSLPVGGVDGTLRRRFRDSPARRLIRAKTGRINGVLALSGVAQVEAGREAVFSIVVNDFHCGSWQVETGIDKLVEALVAEAPAAPDPRMRLDVVGGTPEPAETPQEPTDEPADEPDDSPQG